MNRVAKFGAWKKNHKTGVGRKAGHWDSNLERQVGNELEQRRIAGDITDIRRQVDFPLVVNGIKVGTYRADYVVTKEDGSQGVFEAKGIVFEVGRLKMLLFEALYPEIELTIVRR